MEVNKFSYIHIWENYNIPLYLNPTLSDNDIQELNAMSRSSASKKSVQVRPDSKGRITLGRFAEGVSSFRVSEQPGGAVLLEPMVEIPAREKWLFENKTALESVKRGLDQSAKGETRSRGSFAKYADESDEKDE